MKDKNRFSLWHFDFALSGLSLTALIILTSMGVISRYMLNNPITWLEEVQMMLIVWTTFMGGSVAVRMKGHVAIEVIVELFPTAVQRVLSRIVLVFVIAVLAVVAVQGVNLIAQLASTNRVTSILHIPYAMIYSAMPIGCVMMIGNLILTEGCELFRPAHKQKGDV